MNFLSNFLKSQSNLTNKSFSASILLKDIIPDARVNHLEKENADLKTQILQLKKANDWYMQRIAEQGTVLTKASKINSESNLLKKKENKAKGKRSPESIPA